MSDETPLSKAWSMQGGVGSGKACDCGFWRPGRREVGGGVSENPSFDRSTRRLAVGVPASSPASPTKETVERLSLFLSVKRRQNGENP